METRDILIIGGGPARPHAGPPQRPPKKKK